MVPCRCQIQTPFTFHDDASSEASFDQTTNLQTHFDGALQGHPFDVLQVFLFAEHHVEREGVKWKKRLLNLLLIKLV